MIHSIWRISEAGQLIGASHINPPVTEAALQCRLSATNPLGTGLAIGRRTSWATSLITCERGWQKMQWRVEAILFYHAQLEL